MSENVMHVILKSNFNCSYECLKVEDVPSFNFFFLSHLCFNHILIWQLLISCNILWGMNLILKNCVILIFAIHVFLFLILITPNKHLLFLIIITTNLLIWWLTLCLCNKRFVRFDYSKMRQSTFFLSALFMPYHSLKENYVWILKTSNCPLNLGSLVVITIAKVRKTTNSTNPKKDLVLQQHSKRVCAMHF